MSAEGAIRSAVVAALRADAALMALLNGLYDGAPVQASQPYAAVAECAGSDWGAKGVDGRELRLSIALFDKGETPARIAAMLGRVEVAMRGLDGTVEGWRIVTVRFVRSRVARAVASQRREGGWQGVVDYRLRAVAEG
jgi:hypothetical protein